MVAATDPPIVTIGILRETYGPWERRSPLTPQHVRDLLHKHPHNLRILVQPCQRRVFAGSDYQEAGAILSNDLTDADLILGVKRPAHEGLLLGNKTYMFFSHTIKGQPENMPLLQACLDEHVQLMDYERLLEETVPSPSADDGGTNDNNKQKRLVSFGRFAGLAGAIDTLHGLGRRLLAEGQSTPLLSCPPAVLCDDLAQAQERLHQIGQRIVSQGLNREEPLVIAVTGKGGAVYGGVMEILDLLPHEIVPPDDLQHLYRTETSSKSSQHQVYLVPVATQDAFERKDDASFDRQDFQSNPGLYRSTLPDKVVRYSAALVNCAYWDPRFPRLLTKDDMRTIYNDGNHR